MSEAVFEVQHLANKSQLSFIEVIQLNEYNIQDVYVTLMQLIENTEGVSLEIDFKNVSHISSAVFGKLVALDKEVRAKGGQLHIVQIREAIMGLFELTKLNRVLNVSMD